MELHDFTVKIPKRKTISIIPTGDWHLGSAACDVDKLKELLNWIKKTPDVYVIGLGDYIDAINLSDKRFDPDMVDPDYKGVRINCKCSLTTAQNHPRHPLQVLNWERV